MSDRLRPQSTQFTTADQSFMAEALRLAKHGLYTCSPNPRVGALVVAPATGQTTPATVVGRGWHQVAGEAHAEINALAMAGEQAKGATVYVTLEPCSHYGKTPPCAEALIAAGVARVVYAMGDPTPEVNGRGHQLLLAAGIAVEAGLMADQAEQLNPGFCKRMRTGLPWVTVKTAMSVDGRVAAADGSSQWITGPAARADVQHQRARACAIVTGIGTVLADDPRLTVRELPGNRQLPQRQPLRVVLDSSLRTPPDAQLFKQPGPVIVACLAAPESKAEPLRGAGAEILVLPAAEQGSGLSLLALMKALAERSINEVLVESGGVVAGHFVSAGLVDRWLCYMAPKLLGSRGYPVLRLDQLATMDQQQPLELLDIRQFAQDLRLTYRWSN